MKEDKERAKAFRTSIGHGVVNTIYGYDIRRIIGI
jgi:hypothetical protein